MKKVSVLMTVYNTDRFLRKSINSILNQNYKNFEFIIVDDFSKDKSRKIIKSYKNSRIKKFLLRKHIGRTNALNFGLRKCKGKFIAILDSDDISVYNRLLKQVEFLEKNSQIKMVGSNTLLINEKGKKIKNFYIPSNFDEFNRKMIFNNYLPHSSVMFNKQFLNKTGGSYPKDFIYSQDYALILRFLLKSKIYVLPNILTKSRVSKDNMTNSNILKLTREKEMIKNNFFSYKNFDLSFKEKIFFHFLILKRVLKYTLKLIL